MIERLGHLRVVHDSSAVHTRQSHIPAQACLKQEREVNAFPITRKRKASHKFGISGGPDITAVLFIGNHTVAVAIDILNIANTNGFTHNRRRIVDLLLALEQTGGDKADLGADLLTRKLEPIGRIGGIVIVQPFTLGVCTGQTHVVIEISDTVTVAQRNLKTLMSLFIAVFILRIITAERAGIGGSHTTQNIIDVFIEYIELNTKSATPHGQVESSVILQILRPCQILIRQTRSKHSVDTDASEDNGRSIQKA